MVQLVIGHHLDDILSWLDSHRLPQLQFCSATSFTNAPTLRLSKTICALTSSGQCWCASGEASWS